MEKPHFIFPVEEGDGPCDVPCDIAQGGPAMMQTKRMEPG